MTIPRLTGVGQIRRLNFVVQTCSLVLAPPRLGFSFFSNHSASFSDSAPSFAQTRRPEEPRSIEGLHGNTSTPKRIVSSDTNSDIVSAFSLTRSKSHENQLQPESAPLSKTKHRLSNKCIAFVRSSLGLRSKPVRAPKDAIFIAIDTEGTKADLTELGISTFDTRDVKNISPGPSALEWAKHVKPRQFRFKTGQRRPFLFGALEHRVPLSAIRPYLKLHHDRVYILVGHALNNDIEKLNHALGYELRNEPNIVAIVDTYTLASQCRETLPGRLSELWRFLVNSSPGNATPADVIRLFSPKQQTEDFKFESNHAFHNAGNDAFYNMHILLMLSLQPGLLREPEYSSSLAGVLLSGRSKAWQLVRRLVRSPTSGINSMASGSFVRRPEGVASVQPPQDIGSPKLTLRIMRPKS